MSNAIGRSCQPGGTHVAFLLRLPREVVDHLDACARASYRTRTAEVVKRLQESMANESIDEHGVIVVDRSTPHK